MKELATKGCARGGHGRVYQSNVSNPRHSPLLGDRIGLNLENII